MTKPEIARELIFAALDARTPAAFVLADALYGSDRRLRRMLEARETTLYSGGAQQRADADRWQCARTDHEWRTRRCVAGQRLVLSFSGRRRPRPSVVERVGASAAIVVARCALGALVLMRRSRNDPAAVAYYIAFTPAAHDTLPNWPPSPAYAGPSRPASRPPRMNSASITARRVRGTPGIGTSRWSWQRWRFSPSCAPTFCAHR